ncbi:hypothetical protein ABEX78_32305 [Priestia megaterium]
MNQLKWDVVKKTKSKNTIGEVINSYETIGSLYSSHLLPATTRDPITDYGFDPANAYKFHTRGDIGANTFIRSKDVIYHIRRVEKYPRHSVCFVEVIQ